MALKIKTKASEPDVAVERRRRIQVALWAYAYEIKDKPLVDDARFDATCALIKPEVSTGNAELDAFFKEKFSPHTGQWIHEHPNLAGIEDLYDRVKEHFNA